MPKIQQTNLYTPEQIAHIEKELGEGQVESIEPMARWVKEVEQEGVPALFPPAMLKSPLRPTQNILKEALEGLRVLDLLFRHGFLNEGDPEDWVNLGSDDFEKLRRQLEDMLEKKKYKRPGRPPTPQHTKRLVFVLANAWERHHGEPPSRRHHWDSHKDYGPFLDLVLIVFAPIRPDGEGIPDLVRKVLKERKELEKMDEEERLDHQPRLKWPW